MKRRGWRRAGRASDSVRSSSGAAAPSRSRKGNRQTSTYRGLSVNVLHPIHISMLMVLFVRHWRAFARIWPCKAYRRAKSHGWLHELEGSAGWSSLPWQLLSQKTGVVTAFSERPSTAIPIGIKKMCSNKPCRPWRTQKNLYWEADTSILEDVGGDKCRLKACAGGVPSANSGIVIIRPNLARVPYQVSW